MRELTLILDGVEVARVEAPDDECEVWRALIVAATDRWVQSQMEQGRQHPHPLHRLVTEPCGGGA